MLLVPASGAGGLSSASGAGGLSSASGAGGLAAFQAPNLDYIALGPEIILTATLVVAILVDVVLDERSKVWVTRLTGLGILLATLPIFYMASEGISGQARVMFGGAYVTDTFSLVLKALLLVSAFVVFLLSFDYIADGDYYEGEFAYMVLSSLLGMVVMASSRDLVTIFVALELLSIPGYLLAGWRKRDQKSNEASLKYYLLGVLASSLMLYGMSLIYGFTGSLVLSEIGPRLAGEAGDKPIVAVAIFLVIVGFAFKISAVPFHFWAPDTYEGAPSPVAAFLSTASKIGGFVGLLVLMFKAFPEVADIWRPVFAVLATLTMTVGNLIALRQRHIIRLLAYSGIAQSGYILVALALIDPSSPGVSRQALESALVYIAIYGVMDLGAFAAVVAYARRGGTYFIDDYAGLWQRSPVLATLLTGFLLSLAGAPPMAGAWAKLFVFLAAINAQVYWLAVVMGVNAVIAAWYYLAVVKRMFFEAPELEGPVEVPYLLRAVMGVAALALLVVFVYPPVITELAERSVL